MKNITLLLLASAYFACTPNGADNSGSSTTQSGSSFSEQDLLAYLEFYPKLKDKAPEALELVNEHEAEAKTHKQFHVLEQMIRENGRDYDEFVALSSKIGVIYSFMEANMDTYNEMNDATLDGMDDMEKSIQEMIDDPNTPESQKPELRKSLKRAQDGKKGMNRMFENNKTKASDQFERAQKKLRTVASEKEIALVKKYEKQLKEAFDGVSRPRLDRPL